ncbi:hypothetical protein [Devosia sp. Root635]|uniref:hypothetical protein n=1 Tax=Devosia sp. Root635 TaxID=1736575 RepID=UPI000AA3E1B7|nr:hypothetical protein [Devosia sp. Root635]
MAIRRFVVPVTLSSGGAAEVYSPVLSGKLVSIRYVKDDFADTVDFVLTAEDTGETLWSEENVTASATRHPRAATHSTAGAAALYAAAGTAVNDKIALGQDRVKIVIANGGNATSGTFHITIDG